MWTFLWVQVKTFTVQACWEILQTFWHKTSAHSSKFCYWEVWLKSNKKKKQQHSSKTISEMFISIRVKTHRHGGNILNIQIIAYCDYVRDVLSFLLPLHHRYSSLVHFMMCSLNFSISCLLWGGGGKELDQTWIATHNKMNSNIIGNILLIIKTQGIPFCIIITS